MKRSLSLLCSFAAVLVSSTADAVTLPQPLFGGSQRPRLVLSPPPLISDESLRDVYILPTRPGQNRVAYWDYEWRTYDFNTDRGGGGVRLYFYDRARQAAEYAVASIRDQYVRLTDEFHYLPRSTIPFILYASSAEFQATNVFFISEGTLGATDPRDLRMALPFFGNVHQFTRVSTHEMAHQLTIQKVRDAAAGQRVENPLGYFPLWFIEGVAEYMTFSGMDPEGDYILRDLVTNPDPMKGYALPDFFNARAGGYIGVYKLGQARLTFLSEVYGHQKIIELLERSPEMSGAALARAREAATRPPDEVGREEEKPRRTEDEEGLPPDAKVPDKEAKAEEQKPVAPRSFEEYVALVLGESPNRINARYLEWMKKRYYADFIGAHQTVADFRLYRGLAGEPDSLAIADDGHLIVYRTVERETGLSSVYVQDLRDPSSRELVARDQRPGLESLHPVDRRVTAIRGGRVVFAARSGEDDSLFVVDLKASEKVAEGRVRVDLDLSGRERFDLDDILEIYDPALSPDGKQVAFAGIDPGGFRDLYVVALEGADRGKPRRITRDVWSESDVSWDGERLLFISDRTESHEPSVFALDVASGKQTRLTFGDAEDRHPVAAMGGVVFRSLRSGKPDLWLLKDGRTSRLTDTPSAVLAAVPTTGNALLALVFHSGEHHLYRLPQSALLDEEAPQALTTVAALDEAGAESAGDGAAANPDGLGADGLIGRGGTGLGVAHNLSYPTANIPQQVPDYDPSASRNWRVEASAAAMVGPTSVGAAGLAVTDLLRDHVMLVNLAVYGSLKLTDALVFYVNQSKRVELGIGAFHTFEPRRDKTFPTSTNYYLQREFGVAGLVRYPFDRFRRLEASLEIRGVDRFSFTDYTGELGGEWERLNGAIEPELVASTMFGYDTTRMHAFAGPVEGSSLMAAASLGYLPVRQFAYARFTADAEHRIRLIGRSHLMARAAAGATTGGRFSPQFFLYSVGNLEGFRFGDDRLLGDHFYVSNLRLNFPIDQLVMIPIFTGIYGVAGLDFGATFDSLALAWDSRSLSAVLGTDLALGPLVLQLHFGKLLDIGGLVRSEPWVFNLNLKYLYF